MRELGFDVCTVASNENDAIELAKRNAPELVCRGNLFSKVRVTVVTAFIAATSHKTLNSNSLLSSGYRRGTPA